MVRSVLIGDDNEQIRDLIAAVLGPEGYELRLAVNGQAVLDELARRPADVVILDLHMPGVDGLTILRTIRSDRALDGTRVVMLSGDVVALDTHAADGSGADAHLAKPFAIGALTETVRRLLS